MQYALVRLAFTLALLSGAGAAVAQDSALRRWSHPAPESGIGLVEIAPALPGERPRRALRMPFESATRAMRGLGVDAEDCTSLLRSNTSTYRPDPAGSERLKVSVSLAMSCRFF
ncbi:hypothetical protein [Piscinibacter sp. XHJ-5]|uniref:hypothetical protein n=1 Tax=Piscinibacter sp. XHJ-5 TaxID=3037797 RepID=UPI0024536679|nr:hypothetical protein [Piscinibacter sp. XHJ-5]